MDNRIIDKLRVEARDALVHWAKTDKGYFFMKDALEKYFEATGANRSCGNDKETILLGRRIAAQRIVIIFSETTFPFIVSVLITNPLGEPFIFLPDKSV